MRLEKLNPTPAELEILTVLWSAKNPLTVREVQELLPARSTGYTTILKTMQIMLDKGLLSRESFGKAHKYSAVEPRELVQGNLVSELMERAFGGASRMLVMHALAQSRPSSDELDEIREMLDRLKTGAENHEILLKAISSKGGSE